MRESSFENKPSLSEALGDKNEFADLTEEEIAKSLGKLEGGDAKKEMDATVILEGKNRLKGALDELSDDTVEMLLSFNELDSAPSNIDDILEESAVRAGLAVLGAKLSKGPALASLTEMARTSLEEKLKKRLPDATAEVAATIDKLLQHLDRGAASQEKAA